MSLVLIFFVPKSQKTSESVVFAKVESGLPETHTCFCFIFLFRVYIQWHDSFTRTFICVNE